MHTYTYYDSHSCFRVANAVFVRINNLGYVKQLFLIMHVNYDVSKIAPFYQSLMKMWSLFSRQKWSTAICVLTWTFQVF